MNCFCCLMVNYIRFINLIKLIRVYKNSVLFAIFNMPSFTVKCLLENVNINQQIKSIVGITKSSSK